MEQDKTVLDNRDMELTGDWDDFGMPSRGMEKKVSTPSFGTQGL